MVEAPKLLHESQGLKIVKNQGNQFCVVTLHYSSDPSKRSPEWRCEAGAGMTLEQAARELDIDYTAVMGAKVFPEILEQRAQIVISDPYPDFGPGVKYFGGFDYGTRNPSSFHVYTLVDGVIYSVWELFEPCTNIAEFAAKMREFTYWNSIRWIAADPNIWAPSQQAKEGLVSIQYMLWQAGIRNLVKGLQDEDAWTGKMRLHWATGNEPTFKIFDRCVNQVREFETAIYAGQSERQLLSSAYKESIADKDNHSLDDCKYFMSKLAIHTGQQQESWKNDTINRWAIPSNQRPQAVQPTSFKADSRGYRIN